MALSQLIKQFSPLASRLSSARFSSAHFSTSTIKVDNPYSGETVCEIQYMNQTTLDQKVNLASKIQKDYYKSSKLSDRISLLSRFCDLLQKNKNALAREITLQMGKPLSQAVGEVNTCIARTKAMIEMAPAELADEILPVIPGLSRKLAKEPVGVVLCVAPWNYPLMTAVNCIVPAVLAGNSVLLKHSPRTPLCAGSFERLMLEAGAPHGLVQSVHTQNSDVDYMIAKKAIQHVQFTGSVNTGHILYKSVANTRFIDIGLELGGKDAAYVAPDANLKYAVESLIDGAMYNAGQSCCGIERVYVHESLYEKFLNDCIPGIQQYVLGDPLVAATNMGPLAMAPSITFMTKQVEDATKNGAKVLIGGTAINDTAGKGRFFAPTLIRDCTHQMSIMTEETFGPILAVASVKDDAHALKMMNDSEYGLTSAVYTESDERAQAMALQLETGTVFKNRCDYLDPYLSWTGQKDTGRGISLSRHGFRAFSRVKSYNFKTL